MLALARCVRLRLTVFAQYIDLNAKFATFDAHDR
jgi:hypothetical protein